MLFNSWIFALFLPVVLACYYCLRLSAQNVLLLVASYFFYGWWDYRFCSLLAISTVVDFFCARGMEKTSDPRRRKQLLAISCLCNLGILGFFKYFNFFIDSARVLLESVGLNANLPFLSIVLPVGISFYTFQTMSYTIDVYRGKLHATNRFIDFAVYVAFFPQLVAGPIERATRLLPQISKPRIVTSEQFGSGCVLILIGLFRKVAIADGVAIIVAEAFPNAAAKSSLDLLIALYLFAIQIYGDFVGYSDIARGTSRLLGIELMRNFEHPYFSTSITEFWRRWHISLSTWLRDYLYIPLGGNRHGTFNTYRNLFATMLLGGLWHGAAWTFVVWGGLHGTYLAVHKWLLGDRQAESENRIRTIPILLRKLPLLILTFHLVALTWIFFRAADFAQAWEFLTGIFAMRPGLEMSPVKRLVAATALLLMVDIPQYLSKSHTVFTRWPVLARGVFYAILILALFALRTDGKVPFIYFQF